MTVAIELPDELAERLARKANLQVWILQTISDALQDESLEIDDIDLSNEPLHDPMEFAGAVTGPGRLGEKADEFISALRDEWDKNDRSGEPH